ncbi:glycine-rich protein 5-like [Anoplophora glabripennis]|uniref:glycine-rich protein 5-like n=1 Tax=Anoplophora glabripennis TaxID=217634 RepID=UPI000873F47F|nr:glycine-rich protein 5-like [Anoplophora glabripennis]
MKTVSMIIVLLIAVLGMVQGQIPYMPGGQGGLGGMGGLGGQANIGFGFNAGVGGGVGAGGGAGGDVEQ